MGGHEHRRAQPQPSQRPLDDHVTGAAVTWDGIRPPEGIDFRTYSITRKR